MPRSRGSRLRAAALAAVGAVLLASLAAYAASPLMRSALGGEGFREGDLAWVEEAYFPPFLDATQLGLPFPVIVVSSPRAAGSLEEFRSMLEDVEVYVEDSRGELVRLVKLGVEASESAGRYVGLVNVAVRNGFFKPGSHKAYIVHGGVGEPLEASIVGPPPSGGADAEATGVVLEGRVIVEVDGLEAQGAEAIVTTCSAPLKLVLARKPGGLAGEARLGGAECPPGVHTLLVKIEGPGGAAVIYLPLRLEAG